MDPKGNPTDDPRWIRLIITKISKGGYADGSNANGPAKNPQFGSDE
jgi:hypothetical protein